MRNNKRYLTLFIDIQTCFLALFAYDDHDHVLSSVQRIETILGLQISLLYFVFYFYSSILLSNEMKKNTKIHKATD